MKYCVYFTAYSGNKLPPFYIGYSTVENVQKGYVGSVSSKEYKEIWNSEKEINMSKFKTRIIKTFNTSKEARQYESKLFSHLNVSKNNLYTNYGNYAKKRRYPTRISKREKEIIFHEQLKAFMGDLYY